MSRKGTSLKKLQEVFDEFKKLADKKKDVYDADIAALIEKQMTVAEDQWKLVAYEVLRGAKPAPSTSHSSLTSCPHLPPRLARAVRGKTFYNL